MEDLKKKRALESWEGHRQWSANSKPVLGGLTITNDGKNKVNLLITPFNLFTSTFNVSFHKGPISI